MAVLFSEKRWTGEFFPPDAYEKRFCGEINYSPEEGVVFSYTITGSDFPEKTQVLHGVLSTGDKCTLIGLFPLQRAGFSVRNNLSTRPGKTGFSALAIGDFLAPDERVSSADFSLTNLQEFFFPRGFKDHVKYSEKAIYSVATPFGKMEVGNTATFHALSKDIESHIYSDEPSALNELSLAFKDIEAKYPQSCFMLKKDIAFRIFLEFTPAITIIDAYKHIADFSDIFALLLYGPVYPESIHVRKPGTDNSPIKIELYPSMVIDPRTIELTTGSRSHWLMPIKQSTVPLDAILSNWLREPKIYSVIVSSIQHETGFRDTHAAHGEIVLYASQLESISYDDGKKDKKYEYPLATYGCEKLREGLANIFGKSTLADTAIAVGKVRDEIVHVGRPKHWLTTLSLSELVQISTYLQLTVIGYILTKIGVPKNTIVDYQEKYAPNA
ncbi:MAG: hypothetical protein ACSLE5_14155 [Porticoccaceae bacterium]